MDALQACGLTSATLVECGGEAAAALDEADVLPLVRGQLAQATRGPRHPRQDPLQDGGGHRVPDPAFDLNDGHVVGTPTTMHQGLRADALQPQHLVCGQPAAQTGHEEPALLRPRAGQSHALMCPPLAELLARVHVDEDGVLLRTVPSLLGR